MSIGTFGADFSFPNQTSRSTSQRLERDDRLEYLAGIAPYP
jgi:hypothetical protein